MQRTLALIDIDGVLADDRARVPYALERQWAEYFDPERMSQDAVWSQGRALVHHLRTRGRRIAYLTGRREDRREVTVQWLKQNGFPSGVVFMRPEGQKARLAELKAERIAELLRSDPGLRIVLYDDDPEVIRTVRQRFGDDSAVHCSWYVKPAAMIRHATA